MHIAPTLSETGLRAVVYIAPTLAERGTLEGQVRTLACERGPVEPALVCGLRVQVPASSLLAPVVSLPAARIDLLAAPAPALELAVPGTTTLAQSVVAAAFADWLDELPNGRLSSAIV